MVHHLQFLKRDASPGVPFCELHRTNAGLIEDPKAVSMLVEAVVDRMKRLLDADFTEDRWTDVVDRRLSDPVRIFVKTEPHKRSKIDSERYRLIWSISVVDQLVERCLWYAHTKTEISSWEDLPSKPGMGLDDEGLSKLASQIACLAASSGMKIADRDVHGSDMQVSEWLMLTAHLSTWLQYTWLPADSDWFRIHRARHRAGVRPVLVDGDGRVYTTDVPALMCSGRFITSFMNSRIYTTLSLLRGESSMAMGDDTIETNMTSLTQPQGEKFYAGFGIPVDFNLIDLGADESCVSFCSSSFKFKRTARGIEFAGATPENWVRSLTRLIHKISVAEDGSLIAPVQEVDQFAYEMRNMPSDFRQRVYSLLQ